MTNKIEKWYNKRGSKQKKKNVFAESNRYNKLKLLGKNLKIKFIVN